MPRARRPRRRANSDPENSASAGRIGGRVHHPDTPLLMLGVTPVSDARRGGRERRQDADRDQAVGRRPALRTADCVEHQRTGPRADWNVGQQRVQRVPQPGTTQAVLQRPRRQPAAHGRGKRIGDAIEKASLLEAGNGRIGGRARRVELAPHADVSR
jgi:general stress protein YciG